MIDVTNHVQPESTTDNFELIINTTNNAQPQLTTTLGRLSIQPSVAKSQQRPTINI
jgi:hypothetical protein